MTQQYLGPNFQDIFFLVTKISTYYSFNGRVVFDALNNIQIQFILKFVLHVSYICVDLKVFLSVNDVIEKEKKIPRRVSKQDRSSSRMKTQFPQKVVPNSYFKGQKSVLCLQGPKNPILDVRLEGNTMTRKQDSSTSRMKAQFSQKIVPNSHFKGQNLYFVKICTLVVKDRRIQYF